MSKKVSACRTEVRVVYHCEVGRACDFFHMGVGGVCDSLHKQDHYCYCTLRASQRAGRKAARQRGATNEGH